MATKENILTTLYSALESAATGTYTANDGSGGYQFTVTDDQIRQSWPNDEETYPRIVYAYTDTKRLPNGVGRAPERVIRNQNDVVQTLVFREHRTLQTVIQVRAENDWEMLPIYDAVHDYFGKFQLGGWYPTSFHDDVDDIVTFASASAQDGQTEGVIRGNSLEVHIDYYREYEKDVDAIEDIDMTVEGINYTI